MHNAGQVVNIISLFCCDWFHENAADTHYNPMNCWGPNRSHIYEGGTVPSACARGHLLLIYCDLIMLYDIGCINKHWFRQRLATRLALSHYLNLCWLFVEWTSGTIFSKFWRKIQLVWKSIIQTSMCLHITGKQFVFAIHLTHYLIESSKILPALILE